MFITGIYAAILAFIYTGLSYNVVRQRRKNNVPLGNGESKDVEKAMRAHGNFAENIPFLLVLLFMIEFKGGPSYLVHLIGSFALLGRILHAQGILKTRGISYGRFLGMVLTYFAFLISGGTLIYQSLS